MSPEATMHQQVCDYLRLQHRGIIFHSDFAAGLRMTLGQATKNKRLQSGRAWPDLFIAEPRGKYHGLFVELKPDGTRIHKKDGAFASEHIREQAEMLEELYKKGYDATFGIGFNDTKQLIDHYLSHA